MVTIEQIRAARALLGWSQSDLAEQAGLSQTGIARIENGTNKPNSKTIAKILSAFDSANIEFISTSGVKKASGEIKKYVGQEGFLRFYEDIYKTLETKPDTVYLSNADERQFERWLGEHLKEHVLKILKMKIQYKILIKEGDSHFITSEFSEYRWLPNESFGSVPFYVYGDKIAFVLFEDEPEVIVLDYPAIANAYKMQFLSSWEQAKIPS
jgi:transcriptional regulator with XRE-family HTH domain